MSQGEMVMLRYQYLMQATADAQGDFARTSDGYANSLRLLESNVDSLKTRLGSVLIPALEGATGFLNDFLGALTPTEIVTAHRCGADFVKVFPTSSLGAGYIKAVCAPLNHIRMLAVGGVNENNVAEFLAAGVVGAGVGGNLVNKKWIAAGEFDKITELAKQYVANSK
jgi:hypothetical protein